MPSAASRSASTGDIGLEKSTPASSSRTCNGVISLTTGRSGIVETKSSIKRSTCNQSARRSAAPSSKGSPADNEGEFRALIEIRRFATWRLSRHQWRFRTAGVPPALKTSLPPLADNTLGLQNPDTASYSKSRAVDHCGPCQLRARKSRWERQRHEKLKPAPGEPPAFLIHARSKLACARGPSDSRPNCHLRGPRDGMGPRLTLD